MLKFLSGKIAAVQSDPLLLQGRADQSFCRNNYGKLAMEH